MAKRQNEHTIISWKAPEFFHYKKNAWWFPIQAVATLVLTTLFILTKQYFAAIIIVLGAIVIYRLAHQEPEVFPVIFSTDGIKFKDRYVPFQKIKTFWIIETGNVKRLYLQQVERFSLPVVIPIVKQDVDKVRDFLRHYLPETEEATEDLGDKINRLLKI